MGINTFGREEPLCAGRGSVLTGRPAGSLQRSGTWLTPRAGSPHTANQKARSVLGWGGGVKDACDVESCGRTALPSALVTWGKAERDRVTHVSIQGKGQASARPECPPRALLGQTLSLRGPQGPHPQFPPAQGSCLPWCPAPSPWAGPPAPAPLPARGRAGILCGSGTQTTGWSGSPGPGPGSQRLK